MPDYRTIQKVFAQTRNQLGEILSAFEFFDQACFDLVTAHTNQKKPFDSVSGSNRFYVLIETSGSNQEHDDEVSKIFSFQIQLVPSTSSLIAMENGILNPEIEPLARILDGLLHHS